MSAAVARAGALPAARGTATNPWLIAVLVAGASFMETLDTTIANVVLPYIAGGLGVSEDEASWVVTTYLVANAIIVTATSFLANRLGRKRFFLICLVLFTVSSLMCGLSASLDSILVFRLLQGFAGGGMVPVAQSILADAFPPEKRAQGFALFGVAVVVAPVVGPTLGGWLADNVSWTWCFLINVPVGVFMAVAIAAILHEPASATAERREWLRQSGGFDLIGFTLVATFLGALELALDRGLEDDWFASSFIVRVTAACVLAFVLMIPWEIRHRHPVSRRPDAGDAPVRRELSRHARDRRHPVGDHTVPAATGPAGIRLHGHLGGARAVAGRHRDDADDVCGWSPVGQDPTQVPDHRRCRSPARCRCMT